MNINKIIKSLLVAVIIPLGMIACKPDPELEKSEKYVSATANFKVSNFKVNIAESTPIDFTKQQLKFNASFNEEVSWTINIIGLSDPAFHALKTIKGTSKNLDSTLAVWGGESDNAYFFKLNEPLDIKISFLGADTSFTFTNYKVGKTKSFHGKSAIVVMDFELDSLQSLVNNVDNVNIFFDTDTKNEELQSGKFITKDAFPGLPVPAQGDYYIYLKGQDIVGEPSSFYIGGFNGTDKKFGLKNAPLDSIYFNMYANSNGNKTTKVVISLDGINGDKFKIERNITWDGWRLVSAKLTDFIQGEVGALGPGKIYPANLKRFNIEIHSGDGPGKEAELVADFICFTYGKPFSQSN